MTIEETRQLGIEFERRLQEIYPGFESKIKLDTDTIYSFLNEYQLKYVNDLYLVDDEVKSNSRSSRKLNDIIKGLVKHSSCNVIGTDDTLDYNTVNIQLPSDYYLYIRSNSYVTGSYKSKTDSGPLRRGQIKSATVQAGQPEYRMRSWHFLLLQALQSGLRQRFPAARRLY